jgi:hypothetical protein
MMNRMASQGMRRPNEPPVDLMDPRIQRHIEEVIKYKNKR